MVLDVSNGSSSYLDWATRGKPAIWRYVLALILSYVLWMALPVLLLAPFVAIFQVAPEERDLLEYSFIPGFIVLPLVVRFVLGRPSWSIAVPAWPPRFVEYWHGVLLGLALSVFITVTTIPWLGSHFVGFEGLARTGLISIVAMALGFMVQTAFEEMLFRGLIAQFTARIVNYAPAIIGVQALIFGYLHIGNVKAWNGNMLAMFPYFFTALSWGWVAWRTGSLFFPAALHFVNNAGNTFLLGTNGDIVKSIAPVLVDMPTIGQSVAMTFFSGVSTIAAVELYMRAKERRRSATAIAQAPMGE